MFYLPCITRFLKLNMSQICDNHINFNLDFANFKSLEVVDRGSETQLQEAENLNFLAQCSKG